jgi:hypothetical protein
MLFCDIILMSINYTVVNYVKNKQRRLLGLV